MQLDEGSLAALDPRGSTHGRQGLGIDRLLMLYTGAGIQETTLFPLLRPHG